MRTRSLGLALGLSLAPPIVLAQTSAEVVAPAGAGQQVLAVKVSGEKILARACAAAPCDASAGNALALPDGFPASGAKLQVVDLALGRHAALALVPHKEKGGGTYAFLLTAPLSGKPSEPDLIVKGTLDRRVGEIGEGKTTVIRVEQLAKGSRVLVGEHREDVTLCGRPALVSARELDPSSLELVRGALVQNLPEKERASAHKLVAKKDGAPQPPLHRVLRAQNASSAVGKRVATLTDGSELKGWAEERSGDGRGEFVTMNAPKDLPLTAVELWLTPGKAPPVPKAKKADAKKDDGRIHVKQDGPAKPGSVRVADAPKKDEASAVVAQPDVFRAPAVVWVATDSSLYRVELPKDAGKGASAERFVVDLPAPVQTSCVAVVLDETPSLKGDADVGLAEVVARTPLGGASVARPRRRTSRSARTAGLASWISSTPRLARTRRRSSRSASRRPPPSHAFATACSRRSARAARTRCSSTRATRSAAAGAPRSSRSPASSRTPRPPRRVPPRASSRRSRRPTPRRSS
jgi:hypothetical protein